MQPDSSSDWTLLKSRSCVSLGKILYLSDSVFPIDKKQLTSDRVKGLLG